MGEGQIRKGNGVVDEGLSRRSHAVIVETLGGGGKSMVDNGRCYEVDAVARDLSSGGDAVVDEESQEWG